jgi:type IV pilus assembly protein PilN
MRLDINLASQPYEDARQFWLRWGSALVVVGLLTMVLLAATLTGWLNARHDHARISELRAQIADRDQRRTHAEEFLNRPENRTTRDESQFLNDLIDRHAFSWTHMLEDLEKVMPAHVHVVSIHPELDEDNQLRVKMTVEGDSRDRAIELVQRMEDSHRFAQTYIPSEHADASHPGQVQIGIEAIYVPQSGAPQNESASESGATRSASSNNEISKRENP